MAQRDIDPQNLGVGESHDFDDQRGVHRERQAGPVWPAVEQVGPPAYPPAGDRPHVGSPSRAQHQQRSADPWHLPPSTGPAPYPPPLPPLPPYPPPLPPLPPLPPPLRERVPAPTDQRQRMPVGPPPGPVDGSGMTTAMRQVPAERPEAVRGWSQTPAGRTIGPAGRAFDEVEPLLGDPGDAPDTIVDGGRVAEVTVRAASVRGLSHRQKGISRQDSYGLAATRTDDWLVVVVADGVSAGHLSHRAAQLDLDWDAVFQDLAGRIVGTGAKLLGHHADTRGDVAEAVAEAMSTTASILVCEARPTGEHRLICGAWFGDSPVMVLERGRWFAITGVKNAGREVATSAVAALPHLPVDGSRLPVFQHRVRSDAAVFVMTDGVGDPLGDGRGEVGEALEEAWSRPPNLYRFVEQVAFGRKSYDDDRTVVGIWPRGGR
jgi:hypothetical protein